LVTLNYRLGAFGKCQHWAHDSVSYTRRDPIYLSQMYILYYSYNIDVMRTGFLSTEDTEAPGNYGLLDQSLALRYVKYV
jgi:carboxylesterase type B